MKYCLSSRQNSFLLKKADEIKVEFRDKGSIYDLIEDFPEKRIILSIPAAAAVDFAELSAMADAYSGEFVLALQSMEHYTAVRKQGLLWYYDYPIDSWSDARQLVELGAYFLIPGIPLFFQMEKLQSLGVKIRVFPTICFFSYLPRMNGKCGQWIRPENVDLYEPYVESIEFFNKTLKQEETLFHVYAENKEWPGNLNLLLDNLRVDCDNRAFPEEVAVKRLNCGGRCFESRTCHLCYSAFSFMQNIEDLSAEKRGN